MKRKIFNVLFALVLLASFSLVTAVPVAAGEPGVMLGTTDIAKAEWTAETAAVGDYSAKLYWPKPYTPEGGEYTVPRAFVIMTGIPDGLTINEVNSWSYGVNAPEDYAPNLTFYIETEAANYEGKDYDTTISAWPKNDPPLADVWFQVDETTIGGYQGAYVVWSFGESSPKNKFSWSDIQTAYGAGEIVQVKIGKGTIGTNKELTVYIDDFTINGVPYPLEWTHVSPIQVDDDRAEFPDAPFQTIQGAIDCAFTGDTITVAAGKYAGAIVNMDLTISGAPGGTSIITTGVPYSSAAGAPSYTSGFRLDDGADGAEINNFTINGDKEEEADFRFGVFARNADSVIVDSLALNDMVQGITNWGGSNWEITNNVITETYPTTGGGIAIYLGADVDDFPHCDNNLVQGNTITTNRAGGSTFTGAAIALWFDEKWRYAEPIIESVTGNEIKDNSITATGLENQVGIEIGVGGLKDDTEKVAACLGVIHDNTVTNNTIDNAEWGLYLYVTTNLTVSGNTIKNCSDCGIYMKDDHANCLINNNNIYGNTNYGLNNTDGVTYGRTVDATKNWWGDKGGPGADFDGDSVFGDPVSGNVDYSSWFGARVEDSRSEETVAGDDIVVDAKDEADTDVIKSGTGTPTITVAKYTSNPGTGFSGDTGKYIDVHVDDPAGVTEIEIKVYYTDAEIKGLVESSLILRWWDGTRWVACSDTGVITTDIPGSPPYSGYIWAKIRNDTIPTLDQLSGTVFGGSGRAPIVGTPPPPPPPVPPPGTTDVRGKVSTAGVFTRSVTAPSEDGLCTLTIPEGTVGLTEELEPLTEVTIMIMDEPPPPPEAAYVIGLAYDLEPDGATFEPPVTLTFSYDPADIPEGVAEEDLVLAFYIEGIPPEPGEWIELEGCVVDTVANTITAPVAHFTTFGAMVFIPAPAAFSLSGLEVSPAEVETGDTITISAVVENTGGEKGTCEVTLEINGKVEETKNVALEPGASETVTFTTSRDVAGSYSVDANGLNGSFTVKAPPELPPEEAPPEEMPPEIKPINWPLVGGLIAAVVVVVGLLFFFLVRRRKAY